MEIISKSIQELSHISELKLDTEVAVQRVGARNAEKTNIGEIGTLLSREGNLKDNIVAAANVNTTLELRAHSAERDPHGDRSYTDTQFASHVSQTDPHGDRNFATTLMTSHTNGSDPHGDRMYSDTRLTDHAKGDDPHGDRAYTDKELHDHTTSTDPHGDRQYTNIAIVNHSSANDPHGDRAFTLNQINAHNNSNDPHNISRIIDEALKAHNKDSGAHEMTERLKTFDTTIETKIAQTFAQQLGVTIPTMVGGVVQDKFLKQYVVIKDQVELPGVGESNVLYINKTTKELSIWDNSKYEIISSGGNTSINMNTDYIDEGNRQDRKYFKKEDRDLLLSKIGEIESSGGTQLYSNILSTNGKLFLKSLRTEGDVEILDDDNVITLKNDRYTYKALHTGDVELTSSNNILNNITDQSVISLLGTVTAKSYETGGNKTLTNSVNVWEIRTVLSNVGSVKAITKPSNIAIATNGLIISGLSLPTCTVEAYSTSNTLLGTATTQVDGTFTITLASAKTDGSLIRLYTVTPKEERSEPTNFYTTNRSEVKPFEGVSFSKDGGYIRGFTSRKVDLTITNPTGVVLGTGTSDDFGAFNIKLSKAVISNDTLTIVGKVDSNTYSLSDMIVNLRDITLPYNIEYNDARTVVTGYAEPDSLVTISYGTTEEKVGTDPTGKWVLYSFSKPLSTSSSLTISVEQEERRGTIEVALIEDYSNPETLPKVVQELVTAEMVLINKEIKPLIKSDDLTNVDLVFDKVTQKLKIVGKNTSGKLIDWKASLTIFRDN